MISNLYAVYSERLTAYVREGLDATNLPDHKADDVTQDVWLWAMEQAEPPSWPALRVFADWLIYIESQAQAGDPVFVGLHLDPAATPLVPSASAAAPTESIESVAPAEVVPLPATARLLPLAA